MADVNTGDSGGGHGKHQKKRAKKASTRIDMTPMVDLAFLLLTFFVLTSTFNKPKTLEVLYPVDPKDTTENIKIKNALTFLVTKDDKIFYYNNEFTLPGNAEKQATQLTATDYSSEGIRKVLLERNADVRTAITKLEEKRRIGEIPDSTFKKEANKEMGKAESVTVLIKTDDKANFKNVIDIIDELHIAQIGKFAVVDISAPEVELMNKNVQ